MDEFEEDREYLMSNPNRAAIHAAITRMNSILQDPDHNE